MNCDSTRSEDLDRQVREHISVLCGLFVLSRMMSDRRDEDEIIRLAIAAVSSLGSCRYAAGYLCRNQRLERLALGPTEPGRVLDAQVQALDGAEGPVTLSGQPWGWAFPVQSPGGGHRGYLVVGASAEPSGNEQFLLRILAQQTGAAMANGSLRCEERENGTELRSLTEEWVAANERLLSTLSDLQRQRRIYEVLTQMAASGKGEEGIARAVHELTGFAAVVEDYFGNVRTWAGPGRPETHRKPPRRERDQVLIKARRQGHPLRYKDRVIALAQSRSEVLGVLALVDPQRTAGQHEMFALERGASMLAMELAHLRSLADVELRLRRDLVNDLVTGTDETSAFVRAEALGHDLRDPHHVVIVQWRGMRADDTVRHAVERAAAGLQMKSLLAVLSGMVVLVIQGRPREEELYQAIARQLGSMTGSIGVGGRCDGPSDCPRSFHEAIRALETRRGSRAPDGATAFDDLGIYRLLAAGENNREIEQFVREWLGELLDYDAKRRSDLMQTLSQYLECGGNYDAVAEALVIHRSTLRYRLQRIREVTGFDLRDVDTRLNLHVAVRAWKILQGSGAPNGARNVRNPPCRGRRPGPAGRA